MNQADYLEDVRRQFETCKELAERAMVQVDDSQFFLDRGNANSLAVIVKHMAGNMRSRWTDFLTVDGEKPDRNRDSEFEIDAADSRDRLMERWAAGWGLVFDAVEHAGTVDMSAVITIRSEPYTVMQALHRQLSHYAYHGGQIVMLAKQLVGAGWTSLSVPKGGSEQFNRVMREKYHDRRGAR